MSELNITGFLVSERSGLYSSVQELTGVYRTDGVTVPAEDAERYTSELDGVLGGVRRYMVNLDHRIFVISDRVTFLDDQPHTLDWYIQSQRVTWPERPELAPCAIAPEAVAALPCGEGYRFETAETDPDVSALYLCNDDRLYCFNENRTTSALIEDADCRYYQRDLAQLDVERHAEAPSGCENTLAISDADGYSARITQGEVSGFTPENGFHHDGYGARVESLNRSPMNIGPNINFHDDTESNEANWQGHHLHGAVDAAARVAHNQVALLPERFDAPSFQVTRLNDRMSSGAGSCYTPVELSEPLTYYVFNSLHDDRASPGFSFPGSGRELCEHRVTGAAELAVIARKSGDEMSVQLHNATGIEFEGRALIQSESDARFDANIDWLGGGFKILVNYTIEAGRSTRLRLHLAPDGGALPSHAAIDGSPATAVDGMAWTKTLSGGGTLKIEVIH